jgi:hypothetical protein
MATPNRPMTAKRVGDRIEHQGQPHVITALDFIAKKATIRPVDDSQPVGERWGSAVVIPLSAAG